MQQRVHKDFKDVLIYEKRLKMIFNKTEYWVFKERLENSCSIFYKKLKNINRNKYIISCMDYVDFSKFCDFKCNYANMKMEMKENIDGKEESLVHEDRDIKEEIFATFVKCINGEEIKIKEENSIGLLILSIEFGYERLRKECVEYISKEDLLIKSEIKKIIEEIIRNMNKNKKEERDFNEFERIISKYFNVALESENEMLKNLTIEMLNRIIHNAEFLIENLNDEQKHLFIELIIYELKKEGKSASILMNGIPIRAFSNTDIKLIMKEKSFIVSSYRVGKDEIERMMNNEEKLKEMNHEILKLKEEIKEIKRIKNFIKNY